MPIVTDKHQILFLGKKNAQSVLYMLDANTGQVKWEWSDLYRNPEMIFVQRLYRYENILVIQNGPRNYGINLNTGATQWKTLNSASRDGATGMGRNYFFVRDEYKIYRGDIFTGEQSEVIAFEARPGFQSYAWSPIPVVSSSGDTLLLTYFGEIDNQKSVQISAYLGLYNLSKKELLYKELIGSGVPGVNNFSVGGGGQIYNNRLYTPIGKHLQCFDVRTGKSIWKQEVGEIFLASGVSIADGKVLAACEDVNLYAFDAETGKILWKQPIAGTTNTPFYMNGVVYIISGGDGLFYALDANSGQILWKKESPDMREDSGAFFFGYVTGEKGKVYVQSYRSAYCYQAAR